MEIIKIKVPDGTKASLRRVSRNVSALLRDQIQRLIKPPALGSVYDRAAHLCGVIKGGPADMATSKEYLKQYSQKRAG